MPITAKELASHLNLSAAAVSMALNNKTGVSTVTRQRVIAAAREFGYDFSKHRDPSRHTAEKGTITFLIYKKHGAVVADTPFFGQLTEGIEQACSQASYILNVNYLYESEDIPSQLERMNYCNGILLLGTEMRYQDFQPFDTVKTPLVVLDTYYENLKYDCVLINNFQGAYQAACHLLKTTGAQPGYLRSSYRIGNFDERADGFYRAIRDFGLSPSHSQSILLTPSLEGAYEDMKSQLRAGVKPARCYFADNDLIAAGAMKALKEAGFLTPADVALVGFDDMPLCTFVEPSLTTINVPKQYLGHIAVERLTTLIDNRLHYPVKTEIGTQLIRRHST
ncbi:MAG: LacI family DNA-binding transcriptional regulator [Eubacteriales bacterium]|nr:LacI family DNA-binding transcriptional regulator [Eubacteriales bacterium]